MMRVEVRLEKPHPGQLRLDQEAGRFNVLNCGRRYGKTHYARNRAITHPKRGLLAGCPVGWFAPTYKLLDEAFRDFIRCLPPEIIKDCNKSDRRLELVTGGVLECWTTEGGDPGRSRKYAQAFWDEAAKDRRLMETWQKAIRATLADMVGEAWFMSTPRGMDDFYELWLRGQPGPKQRPGWKSWTMPTATNPFILASEIEDARLDLSDPVFRQEFLAEFVADLGEYYKREWLKLYDPAQIPDVARFLTADLAMSDEGDWSVIMPHGYDHKREHYILPGTRRFRERDGRVIATAFVDMIEANDPEVFIVENTHHWAGIRPMVEEEMERRDCWAKFEEVTPVRAPKNDPSREPKQARARSSQAEAQWGRLWLPDEQQTHDVIMPEMLSFPGGKYDDIVDNIAMGANHLRAAGQGKAPPKPVIVAPPRSGRVLGLPEVGAAAKPAVASRGGLMRRSAFRR